MIEVQARKQYVNDTTAGTAQTISFTAPPSGQVFIIDSVQGTCLPTASTDGYEELLFTDAGATVMRLRISIPTAAVPAAYTFNWPGNTGPRFSTATPVLTATIFGTVTFGRRTVNVVGHFERG